MSDEPVRRGINFPAEPTAGIGGRVLAGVAAVLGLCVVSLGTLGAVLLAPVGMWLAGVLLRRVGRRLTLPTSWLAAVATLCLTSMIVGGVVVAKMPPEVMSQVHQAMDSATKAQAKQPRPAWMDRVTTPAQRAQSDAVQSRLQSSPAVLGTLAFVGGAIGVEFLAVVVGTLGWAAGLLLFYAIKGKWLS